MKCTYCSLGDNSFPYRRRSLESVLSEIDTAVKNYNAGFIYFEDENISLDKKWFMSLLEKIIHYYPRKEIELRAMNGLYPPSLDEEVIIKMKEAGFKTLNLSLCTTSENQLKIFKRKNVKDAVEKSVKIAKKIGMDSVRYIIAGTPGQNPMD